MGQISWLLNSLRFSLSLLWGYPIITSSQNTQNHNPLSLVRTWSILTFPSPLKCSNLSLNLSPYLHNHPWKNWYILWFYRFIVCQGFASSVKGCKGWKILLGTNIFLTGRNLRRSDFDHSSLFQNKKQQSINIGHQLSSKLACPVCTKSMKWKYKW